MVFCALPGPSFRSYIPSVTATALPSIWLTCPHAPHPHPRCLWFLHCPTKQLCFLVTTPDLLQPGPKAPQRQAFPGWAIPLPFSLSCCSFQANLLPSDLALPQPPCFFPSRLFALVASLGPLNSRVGTPMLLLSCPPLKATLWDSTCTKSLLVRRWPVLSAPTTLPPSHAIPTRPG